jgi:hypothetical protein
MARQIGDLPHALGERRRWLSWSNTSWHNGRSKVSLFPSAPGKLMFVLHPSR